MSATLIKIIGLAIGQPHHLDGLFVQAYEPSFSPDGDANSCVLTGTPDPEEARQFDEIAEAWEFAKRVDQRDPVRAIDGRPNRPITAFTLEFISLDAARREMLERKVPSP